MQKYLKQNSIQRFLSVRYSELDCLHYISYILPTIIQGIENVTHLTLPSRGESINLYFLIYYLTIPITEIPTNIVTCGIFIYMNATRKVNELTHTTNQQLTFLCHQHHTKTTTCTRRK